MVLTQKGSSCNYPAKKLLTLIKGACGAIRQGVVLLTHDSNGRFGKAPPIYKLKSNDYNDTNIIVRKKQKGVVAFILHRHCKITHYRKEVL